MKTRGIIEETVKKNIRSSSNFGFFLPAWINFHKQTEVTNFPDIIFAHDVWGFEVAVDKREMVKILQSIQNRQCNALYILQR